MADKSTVISIVPFALREDKPGLYPGLFTIPAAKRDDFEFIIVGRSVHHVYLDMDRGSLSIPTPSNEVARSLCDDYASAQLGYEQGLAEPGLIWIDGEYKDKKSIIAIAKEKIDHARVLQRNWFERLVAIADDEWSKYHTHKSISDVQRFAADFLGLEREWNLRGQIDANDRCPACASQVPVTALVCPICRTVIRPEEYKKRGFQTVGA